MNKKTLQIIVMLNLITISSVSLANKGACYICMKFNKHEGMFPHSRHRFLDCFEGLTQQECYSKCAKIKSQDQNVLEAKVVDWRQEEKCRNIDFH